MDTLTAPPRTADRLRALLPAMLAVAALAASYAPNFRLLAVEWEHPSYSHGYLVIPIALAILWQRRGELDPARLRPHWSGWAAVLATLALRDLALPALPNPDAAKVPFLLGLTLPDLPMPVLEASRPR